MFAEGAPNFRSAVLIVMLNLLIALMGSSYEKVAELHFQRLLGSSSC